MVCDFFERGDRSQLIDITYIQALGNTALGQRVAKLREDILSTAVYLFRTIVDLHLEHHRISIVRPGDIFNIVIHAEPACVSLYGTLDPASLVEHRHEDRYVATLSIAADGVDPDWQKIIVSAPIMEEGDRCDIPHALSKLLGTMEPFVRLSRCEAREHIDWALAVEALIKRGGEIEWGWFWEPVAKKKRKKTAWNPYGYVAPTRSMPHPYYY